MGGNISSRVGNNYHKTIWVKVDFEKSYPLKSKMCGGAIAGGGPVCVGAKVQKCEQYEWHKIKAEFSPIKTGDYKRFDIASKGTTVYLSIIADDGEVLCNSLPRKKKENIVVTEDAKIRTAESNDPMVMKLTVLGNRGKGTEPADTYSHNTVCELNQTEQFDPQRHCRIESAPDRDNGMDEYTSIEKKDEAEDKNDNSRTKGRIMEEILTVHQGEKQENFRQVNITEQMPYKDRESDDTTDSEDNETEESEEETDTEEKYDPKKTFRSKAALFHTI